MRRPGLKALVSQAVAARAAIVGAKFRRKLTPEERVAKRALEAFLDVAMAQPPSPTMLKLARGLKETRDGLREFDALMAASAPSGGKAP